MISFLLCLALLIVGYFVYGKIVDNTFGPDDRETPAVRINDGVDYVVMPQWKLFLVQLLNIAGLGPIFGALQGALWGPVVFLWITFGTIFAGGVHDYFSGMMSERNEGASIAEVTGRYLGPVMQNIMRVFSVVLLIMVGTVFAVGPAGLIVTLCKNSGMSGVLTTTLFWLIIILVYYFIATFISIDAIIGKIYPLFGICLIIMAVGVIFGIFTNPAYTIPEIWANFSNMHPSNTPIWSFMFITVACGAISGFHSLVSSGTTSKQLDSEGNAKLIGYGSMLLEGVLAVVAVVAVGYVGGDKLTELLKNGGPVNVFADGVGTFMTKLGFSFGVAKGFVALTISAFAMTTLDTATRLGRFIFQELFTKVDPKTGEAQGNVLTNPFVATLITVVLSGYMSLGSYLTIWPIFGAANQLLAALSLLAVGVWLKSVGRDNLMVLIPMAFMFCVTLVALAQIIFANMAAHIITAALGSVLFILAIALFLESRKYLFGGAK